MQHGFHSTIAIHGKSPSPLKTWAHLLKGLGQGVLSVANAIAMQLQWLGGAMQPARGQDVLQAEPDKAVPHK